MTKGGRCPASGSAAPPAAIASPASASVVLGEFSIASPGAYWSCLFRIGNWERLTNCQERGVARSKIFDEPEDPVLDAKLPDTAFKEEVLLMMLRTDSMVWPDTITYGSRGIFENTDPYTPLIRKYLPNVEPTVSLINSRGARSSLVAQIEEVRRKKRSTGNQ